MIAYLPGFINSDEFQVVCSHNTGRLTGKTNSSIVVSKPMVHTILRKSALCSRTVLGWFISLGLAIAQALAYCYVLTLSLGPRVILQPWLMRQGYLLYEHIADEHPPLMYLLLSAVQPFVPDGLVLAEIALISLIGITTLLTFWAGQHTGGWLAGVCSAFFFAIWSPVFGYGKLWHETFLAPLYTILLVQWHPSSSHRPNLRSSLVTGFLLGLALLIKQHAIAVVLGLVLWNAFTSWRTHRPIRPLLVETASIILATCLPIVVFTVYHLVQAGTIKNLVFWNITFSVVNNYTELAALPPSMTQIAGLAPAYCLLLPFIVHWWASRENGGATWGRAGWALTLLAASSLTAYPRFGFFHLQASLPILAWLSGTTLTRFLNVRGCEASQQTNPRPLLIGMACSLMLLWTLHAGASYYRAFDSDQPRKIWEYTDLISLAGQVRQQIGPTGCIYVFPDDEATANLYYLMRCRPPKFWIPTSYPWFTLDMLTLETIQALEQASPEWVVYFPERWGIEQHGQEIWTYVQDEYQLETQLSWAEGQVWLLRRRPD